MRKKFQDLNAEDLWNLRCEITLNSLFVNDYENSFGFSASCICTFFDSYMEYLWELAKEERGEDFNSLQTIFDEYDNADNLFDWYWHYEDFDWVEYDPEWTEEEEKEYEDYWNGTK